MAFDQSTRNRLNRFVADSRGVLATEFTRQLQATYGMNPATGDVANINSLAGLTPHQQETAQLLRGTFEHYLAANDHAKGKSKEKERRLAALDRIVREQAFTVLNRLAALRMSEARGFLTESLANGYESKGFQLFHRIAGTSLGETGEAYTHYLFSIFDEFALDLSVLFDRFAAQGRLFPSAPILQELLALINDDEVAPLWAEDETIGWIYQYFNSQEERKKMRDASQAPRNSRELAVRNQFFTPRYVVEFLTDNTLGRIWYEMTKGQTKLISECEYLVQRSNEIFLSEGEQAPELDSTEGLSQDELLQQTVYIEHRTLKDPRDIKMLDPACGSMHFGLYCFDLFERIYEEAWDIELAKGSECFVRENNQASLTESYSDKAEFLTHVPRLIIENNIHGVDIDPRAAQVAGMSLWQRAHNSWQKADIKPQQRPQITKSNIVCAEPMPGEKELLQEFTSGLKPTVLGQLVEVIFEKMQLAGEAGTLLKIEKEIENAIAGAKEVWQQQNQALSQFPDLAKVAKQQSKGKGEVDFDVSDIDDEGFWHQAEQKILEALAQYASSTSLDMSEQKRLFASDAENGFAFIGLCKKRFDVLLMNPPFGQGNKSVSKMLESEYPGSGAAELGSSFYTRAINITVPNALFGSITSRTCFYLNSLKDWRRNVCLAQSQIEYMADLGEGILDGAMNETACYVVRNNNDLNSTAAFGMFHDLADKESSLKDLSIHSRDNSRVSLRKLIDFTLLPDAPLCYWVSDQFIKTLPKLLPLDSNYASVQMGLAPRDEYRYSRGWWEVPSDSTHWKRYAKGGELSAYYSDVELVLKDIDDLAEIKANLTQKYPYLNGNLDWVLHPENSYFEPGLTFGQRTTFLRTSVIPAGGYFSVAGKGIFGHSIDNAALMQAINTPACQFLVSLRKERLAIDPQYQEGDVARIPFPKLSETEQKTLKESALVNYRNVRTLASFDEVDHAFYIPCFNASELQDAVDIALKSISESEDKANAVLLSKLNLNDKDIRFVKEQITNKWVARRTSNWYEFNYLDVFSYFVGAYFDRWNIISDEKRQDHLKSVDPFSINTLDSIAIKEPTGENKPLIVFDKTLNTEFEIFISKMLEQYEDIEVDSKLMSLLQDTEKLSDLLSLPNNFFDFHLSRYSKNGRKAPIYLPLQSTTKSLTIYLYYSNLNGRVLFELLNKCDALIDDLATSQAQLKDKNSRSKQEEQELDKLFKQEMEVKDFSAELLRISKFWLPNLNDGVQITAAPLWRLFQHKAWQKKLKQTWEKLQDGEYDWAHLAFSTWPERVLKKCHVDRSLAIAHDVEDDLWHEVKVIKGKKKEPVWEWQPKPLSDAELHAYIKERIATDERLKLYRSDRSANAHGGAL